MKEPLLLGSLLLLAVVATAEPEEAGVDREHPHWSAAGDWIAFDSVQNGNRDLYRVRPDGSDLQRLTTHQASDAGPYWHPNGRELTFWSDREGSPRPYVLDLGTGEIRASEIEGFGFVAPRWDPTGTWALVGREVDAGRELWKARRDGSMATRLVSNGSRNSFAVWAPDSRRIVFASDITGDREIFLLELDSGEPVQLTSSPGMDIPTGISPDGKTVLFHSDRDEPGVFQIFLLDLDTRRERQLTRGPGFHGVPSFSPDGKWIVFEADQGGNRNLFLMSPDGDRVHPLLH